MLLKSRFSFYPPLLRFLYLISSCYRRYVSSMYNIYPIYPIYWLDLIDSVFSDWPDGRNINRTLPYTRFIKMYTNIYSIHVVGPAGSAARLLYYVYMFKYIYIYIYIYIYNDGIKWYEMADFNLSDGWFYTDILFLFTKFRQFPFVCAKITGCEDWHWTFLSSFGSIVDSKQVGQKRGVCRVDCRRNLDFPYKVSEPLSFDFWLLS